LDPQLGDRVVELAAVRVRGKEKLAVFQTLVNPCRPISEPAFEVNKITPLMLEGAPKIDAVLPEFLRFSEGSYLCSYNAGFDLEFLNNEMKLAGQGTLGDAVAVDVLKMSRRMMPGLPRYALWFVAEKLGIKGKQEHRAFSDVELTLEVFYRLQEMLKLKGIVDAQNFLSLFTLSSRFLEDSNNQKISQIQEAMDLGVKLKIKYLSSSNAEVTEREVIPKEIRQDKNHAYLIGHCCLRNEERSFRIDGILHIEIL
jgi:DNA polymerase III epsilon subunit family exonuclease